VEGRRIGLLITVLPLLGIDLRIRQGTQRRKLANGYQLVRQSQLASLHQLNFEYFKGQVGENALAEARSADLYLRVSEDITVSGQAEFQTAVDRLNEKIDRFVLALNMNEKLWNFRRDIRFSWLQDRSRAQITDRHYWPRSTVIDRPGFKDFSEAAKLTGAIDRVYSTSEAQSYYPAVRTAFDALRLGSYAFNTSMRFLQEAIALEAVCSASDTEVTHRVATTCAILAGTGPVERKTLYEEAKRLYSIRSRIIHGSGKRATIPELKGYRTTDT